MWVLFVPNSWVIKINLEPKSITGNKALKASIKGLFFVKSIYLILIPTKKNYLKRWSKLIDRLKNALKLSIFIIFTKSLINRLATQIISYMNELKYSFREEVEYTKEIVKVGVKNLEGKHIK